MPLGESLALSGLLLGAVLGAPARAQEAPTTAEQELAKNARDRDVCHHDPPRSCRDPGAPGVGPSSNGDDLGAGAKDCGAVPSVRATVFAMDHGRRKVEVV